ncbi:hypothetical protein SAMN05192561_103217 [Halopenitus malekzadehii]|uniref:Uncharacterized protein n=1 Tax=Halopenitus malekzadehii TaxID=1267564 RepID=A0A1H6IMT0_9EURY|nr:hypothetical protein [Halopenitus malekzadehii]SEH50386.1 hypothetical protein SAMN05192561_103217 [Halopenitus malekzadehii]
MPALHRSRRSLLAAGAAVLASAAAGCLDGQSSRSRTVNDDPSHPPESATTDFAVETLRDPSLDSIIPTGFDPTDPDGGVTDSSDVPATPTPDLADRRLRNRMWFILEDAHRDRLRFRREPEGTDALRSFLAATDFDSESAVLIQEPIAACYELSTEYVEIEDDEFHASRCRKLRPADAACAVDDRHLLVTALRVPQAYESSPSGMGLGTSSNCRPESIETNGGDDA